MVEILSKQSFDENLIANTKTVRIRNVLLHGFINQ